MKPGSILVPIDVAACPLEVFSFINQFAAQGPVTVTLLYVSRLNVVAPENRLYAELTEQLARILARLQAKFINPQLNVRLCVRLGSPEKEIISEAMESKPELIVMTSHLSHRRHGLFHPDIVEAVVAAAPCPVQVLRVATRLDCAKESDRAEKRRTGYAVTILDATLSLSAPITDPAPH